MTRLHSAPFATALVGVIAAFGCADQPAGEPRLGPHDGLDLSPIEPERVAVGDVAPDFTLPAHGGGTLTLSDFRGKRDVLLVFYRGTGDPTAQRS